MGWVGVAKPNAIGQMAMPECWGSRAHPNLYALGRSEPKALRAVRRKLRDGVQSLHRDSQNRSNAKII
jgi:hypothetical protein